MEEQEIIEVESVEKSVSEPPKQKKPQKAKYQYGRRIEIASRADWFCLRFFFPGFILGALASLAFGILYAQHQDNVFALVMLIVANAVFSLAVLAFLFHFLLGALIKGWKKKDPNFEE